MTNEKTPSLTGNVEALSRVVTKIALDILTEFQAYRAESPALIMQATREFKLTEHNAVLRIQIETPNYRDREDDECAFLNRMFGTLARLRGIK